MASSAILAFGLGSAASAADDGFCRSYARAAVQDVQQAMQHGRCRDQMQGPRWSTDWRMHYNWCRSVRHSQAAAENDARSQIAQDCSRHHHHHDDGDNDDGHGPGGDNNGGYNNGGHNNGYGH